MSIINNFPAGSGENNGLPLPTSFSGTAWLNWAHSFSFSAADVFDVTIDLDNSIIIFPINGQGWQTSMVGRYLLLFSLLNSNAPFAVVFAPWFQSILIGGQYDDGQVSVNVASVSTIAGNIIIQTTDSVPLSNYITGISAIDLAQYT